MQKHEWYSDTHARLSRFFSPVNEACRPRKRCRPLSSRKRANGSFTPGKRLPLLHWPSAAYLGVDFNGRPNELFAAAEFSDRAAGYLRSYVRAGTGQDFGAERENLPDRETCQKRYGLGNIRTAGACVLRFARRRSDRYLAGLRSAESKLYRVILHGEIRHPRIAGPRSLEQVYAFDSTTIDLRGSIPASKTAKGAAHTAKRIGK